MVRLWDLGGLGKLLGKMVVFNDLEVFKGSVSGELHNDGHPECQESGRLQ